MQKLEILQPLIHEGTLIQEPSNGIYSCINDDQQNKHFDSIADIYDLIVRNQVYNFISWGNFPKNYTKFATTALQERAGGVVLDAGCGTLAFTGKLYPQFKNKTFILADSSIRSLEIARDRLIKIKGEVPKNIILLQANILTMPFRDAVFDTVLSLGVLHLFENKASVLDAFRRVMKDSGSLYLTCLCADRWLSQQQMKFLHQFNEMASPMRSEYLARIVDTSGFSCDLKTVGGMAYFSGGKKM